jgi:F-type H+-transporting ATPase subunit c
MEISRDLIAGLTIALGGLGPAMAIGKMTAAAMEALGRNPEASQGVSTNLILALAFSEAIAIYALVVALAVKFVG